MTTDSPDLTPTPPPGAVVSHAAAPSECLGIDPSAWLTGWWALQRDVFERLLTVRGAEDLRLAGWEIALLGPWSHALQVELGRFEQALSAGPAGVRGTVRALALGALARDVWLESLIARGSHASGSPSALARSRLHAEQRIGRRLSQASRTLGGGLVKAAQFASTRPDLLPAVVTDALAVVQDRLPAHPWRVTEATLRSELGASLATVFADIDPVPVASASIAQVHRGRLLDGREVAIKVCHPGLEQLVEADLAAFEALITLFEQLEPDLQLRPILAYLRWSLPREIDLAREADAALALSRAFAHRDDVRVPQVHTACSSARVLVSDWVDGIRITDRAALSRAGVDLDRLAVLLIETYAEQLLWGEWCHADPHPGNLLVQPGPGGPVLVLLDHGLTFQLPATLREQLRDASAAMAAGDPWALVEVLGGLGIALDVAADTRLLVWLSEVLLGRGAGERMRAAFDDKEAGVDDRPAGGTAAFGRRLTGMISGVSSEVFAVGRCMGMVDGVSRQLAPAIDAMQVFERLRLAKADEVCDE
jgi:hypothetical protein